MAQRVFDEGTVRVTLDDGLERLCRRAIDALVPALFEEVEATTAGLHADAESGWPVLTGASRAGLAWAASVSPDGVVRGRIWNDVRHAPFVTVDGGSAFRALLTKPARADRSAFAKRIAQAGARAIRGGG